MTFNKELQEKAHLKRYKKVLIARAQKSQATKALWKINVYDVIVKPLHWEKVKNALDLNKYTFQVHKDANKNDVKAAVKYLFGVDAEAVNIINVPYKGRMQRKLVRRAYKKAIITLKKWDKIDIAA